MIKCELFAGDNLARLQALPDCSIDSVVTDPPYGLSGQPDVAEVLGHWLAGDDYTHRGGGFMGRAWDQFVPGPAVWREVFRVLKPGGHLVAFGGTRTYDLLALAIRLAGFEIRDQLGWLYGSGMPHGQDISKAIDKRAGAQRQVVGEKVYPGGHVQRSKAPRFNGTKYAGGAVYHENETRHETAPATDLARKWEGWNSALKPAWEPILMARKPFAGALIDNVITHGTGALNVAACGIPAEGETIQTRPRSDAQHERSDSMGAGWSGQVDTSPRAARYPANVIHDGSPEVLAEFAKYGEKKTGDWKGQRTGKTGGNVYGNRGKVPLYHKGDTGTAARFFYTAKASKGERQAGCLHLYWQRDPSQVHGYKLIDQTTWATLPEGDRGQGNIHATVKPVALMAWLIRLVTPPGGTTLDPFMGSGTTGVAAVAEGMGFVGMDLDPTIAQARLYHALQAAAQPDAHQRPQDGPRAPAQSKPDKPPSQPAQRPPGANLQAGPDLQQMLPIFGGD